MKVSLEEIRSFVEKALTDYEEVNGRNFVLIKDDLYWRVPDAMLNDMSATPIDLEICSYGEEIAFLRNSLDEGYFGRIGLQYLVGVMSYAAKDES